MSFDDFLDEEVAIAVAATAVAFTSPVRRVLRRSAVWTTATLLDGGAWMASRTRRLLGSGATAERGAGAEDTPGSREQEGDPAEGEPSLRSLTRKDLYQRATERDIRGRSDMTKDELITALERRNEEEVGRDG